jgi:putative transcriptional regulator
VSAASAPVDENSLDELLVRYATGGLNAPLHALVASHLSLSNRNRGFVKTIESGCAIALLDQAPLPLSRREAQLDAIFLQSLPLRSSNASPVVENRSSSPLPAPLAAYMGCDLANVSWHTLIPGVAREYRIEASEAGEASLLWIKAGRAMPSHTHEGSEYTLVLSGAFRDSTGRYERGDIAFGDSDLDHKPVAEPDEDCLCFAVTDAPLLLTNPVSKFLRRLRSVH